MCGRYYLSRRKQLIQEYFDTSDEVDWEPRYNIAPSQSVGIIRQDPAQPERRFSLARWGLIPYWAKDASIGYKLINARSERVGSKPAFREAFESRTVEVRRPRQGKGIPMPLKRSKPLLTHCKATTSSGKPCRAKPHKGGSASFIPTPKEPQSLAEKEADAIGTPTKRRCNMSRCPNRLEM
jgi:hypothetical protein